MLESNDGHQWCALVQICYSKLEIVSEGVIGVHCKCNKYQFYSLLFVLT